MKRHELIAHLQRQGCRLEREGGVVEANEWTKYMCTTQAVRRFRQKSGVVEHRPESHERP